MVSEQPVHIVDYDAGWPRRFEDERVRLRAAIRPWIVGGIEHVGSTAVPNLAAKPVVDIMVGVESLDASRAAIPVLEKIGYRYAPYRPNDMHWFCKPSLAMRTHHLHLIPFEGRLWIERLAFRDYLRTHGDVASEYAELKRRLAEQHTHDREAYTDAKTSFVAHVLELALRDGIDA